MKRLVRRLTPAPAYNLARRWVRSRRQRRHLALPPVSEEALRRLLTDELGLRPGAVAFVHCSLEALNLAFPFFRLLPLLREAVGAQGTLLFPASHLRERPETWLARGEVFDVVRTPTTMGILPELARRQPDAVRSPHPTHSVVALGPLARELTDRHADSLLPCGPDSPYYRIVEHGGLIVGLGVDTRVMTFVHCVEDALGESFPVETRDRRVYEARVRQADGRERLVRTQVAHARIGWRRIPPYMRRHVEAAACRTLRAHGAPFYRADAGGLYRRMEELAGRGITIYPRLLRRDGALEGVLTELARLAA